MRPSGGVPDRIRVEVIGSDVVVLDPDRGIVHRIAPLEAQMLAAGHVEPFIASLGAEVTEAVVTALSVRRWDRRTLLGSGSALVAAGVTTLLLPSAVAAASPFDENIGSLGGFEAGTISFTSVEGGALTTSTSPNYVVPSGLSTVNTRAHGRWTIPTGVTRIQIVAYSTSGTTAFALDSSTEPSPYTGQPGRGVQAVGTFELPDAATRYLGIFFSGSTRWGETPSGGFGASAVGAAFINGTTNTVAWLLVAGGGGGAGDARTWRNEPPRYLDPSPAGTTHVGGNGGDAGTGGAAQAGGGGTADGGVDGRGGGGGTLSAVGAKGSGGAGIDGNDGNPSYGPTVGMNIATVTTNSLGSGGTPANTNSLPGGNGGGGLFGGGGGEAGSTGVSGARLAGGGGGGGSSLLNATYLDTSAASRLMLTNRSYSLGPTIALYW